MSDASVPLARVVIRAKDEAASIGSTLDILAGQSVGDRLEIVVVDSGSRDRTVEIARAAGVRVIEIPAPTFSYGGSLNTGCDGVLAPIVIALSAHAFPRHRRWVERLLEPFEDERVACACGYDRGPDGRPLDGRVVQDERLAREWPFWGYSNAAGAFRSDLWHERPFREDMPGTEDKEWCWHWLQRGWLCVIDCDLEVDHKHERESPQMTYDRARREWEGFALYLDLDDFRLRDLAREWWSEQGNSKNMLRARVGYQRIARLVGQYQGRKLAARRRA